MKNQSNNNRKPHPMAKPTAPAKTAITAKSGKTTKPAEAPVEEKRIPFTRNLTTLSEGTTYIGKIVVSEIVETEKGDRWALKIQLDGRNATFSNVNKLPLHEFSPLNGLLAAITDEDEEDANPEDLVGYEVEFTTRISNEGYCGLKTINLLSDDEDDEEDWDEEDGEEEKDDLEHYFDDDEDDD